MAKVRPLPSVLGCLLGFGLAGCGAGTVPGMWAAVQFRGRVLGPDPAPAAQVEWEYGSVYAGSFAGMLAGGALGVRHARAARQRAGAVAEPGAAADTGG